MKIFVLVSLLLHVLFQDYKYHIIDNRLIVITLLLGFGIAWFEGRLPESLLYSVIGFLLLWLPYALGWVGGGDVKLLAAIGSLVSLQFLLRTVLLGIVFTGFVSLFVLYQTGKIKQMKKLLQYTLNPTTTDYESAQLFVPLGAFISLAGLLLLALQYLGYDFG